VARAPTIEDRLAGRSNISSFTIGIMIQVFKRLRALRSRATRRDVRVTAGRSVCWISDRSPSDARSSAITADLLAASRIQSRRRDPKLEGHDDSQHNTHEADDAPLPVSVATVFSLHGIPRGAREVNVKPLD
jgi:hypothetical protein